MDNAVNVIAPGARIVVRDAEWLVRKVDRTSSGGQAISVVGITELVKDKEAIFLDEIDTEIEVLDPVDTKLVPDTSSSFQKSLLYMESLLRQKTPTDENLYIGHQAAMDLVPYQLDPAIQALKQPRQRILIADAVGLGKTLACGILVSELIRRGRGKRILVLAVKSMLTQFQKEMWSRFTIPLVRLDSIGIQRVRSRIPTNHNPFYYYDNAIISIDTLKQDSEYRTYLESAYWDIIVIDEAHNVAERGKGSSLRAKLAKLLASRSDTLIMLSATPHDGRAKSFASLMNMLDPTAIANPEEYGPEDIKGLFIRRFKKDIQGQVEKAFKTREISKAYCQSSAAEEAAFDVFADLKFQKPDQRRGAGQLFKTTLEKALFSSPAACLVTIKNRIAKLQKNPDKDDLKDITSLEELADAVGQITSSGFAKYQKLLSVIQDKQHGFGWTGKDKEDRLVIFTERIETLKFLRTNLLKDLCLKDNQVDILHGGLPDVDQQRIVEDFGKEEAPVRLLIASDVASEGINLHYLSHRLVHFDIPWSLMVFQQRNGRIDRYGQEETPYILYLVNQSGNAKIKGDMRILELLIKKDDEAVKNIGDPAALMDVYDIDEEEKITAAAIEKGLSDKDFENNLDKNAATSFDPLKLLMGEELPSGRVDSQEQTREMPSLYVDDYNYFKEATGYLKQKNDLNIFFDDINREAEFPIPKSLKSRLRNILPREVWPEKDVMVLSADPDEIQKEIRRSRKDENAWPRKQFLWQQNPVFGWINDMVIAEFGRHEAPVLSLQGALSPGETVFIISGLIPNRKGHPLVHRWFGVTFDGNTFHQTEDFEKILTRTGLGKRSFPNPGKDVDLDFLKRLLPETVKQAKQFMSDERKSFEELINPKLEKQLKNLERLKSKKFEQLELFYTDKKQSSKKDQQRREAEKVFKEFWAWVEDTMTTEDNPYIQVIAVLKGVE
ncbi:MAG: DEAD/DEAH box helicase family protein [Proteobacteria bacterium]|nr:DEAD/DEAH box helicase family protein [Pseudomonadota bacterium]